MHFLNRSCSSRGNTSHDSDDHVPHSADLAFVGKWRTNMVAIGVAVLLPTLVSGQVLKDTYPRIGAIEVGGTRETVKPEYRQALAKHDIVVLGMWRGWSGRDTESNELLEIRDVVVDIKRRASLIGNPDILIGKYTIFMESSSTANESSAFNQKWNKLHSEIGPGYATNNDWWARKSNGENTSSYYGNWNTNVTEHVQRDSNGDTYPEWSVALDYETYFRDVPELDIWFFDNWFYRPRVKADWDGDGVNDEINSPIVQREYRKGFMNGLRRAQQLAPDMIFMGNVDGEPGTNSGMLSEPEYKGQISAFYEGAIGRDWSQETWGTWESMMEQYHITLQNARDRLLIMSVHGEANDYALMRYGLASCLMDDGYYYYTTFDTQYRSALWFDEFDVDLGAAIDPPQFSAWQDGVYRRRFQNGLVLVNPKGNGRQTIQIEPGYRRIDGKQDTVMNNGQLVNSVVLSERDGIVLINVNSDSNQRPKPPVMN